MALNTVYNVVSIHEPLDVKKSSGTPGEGTEAYSSFLLRFFSSLALFVYFAYMHVNGCPGIFTGPGSPPYSFISPTQADQSMGNIYSSTSVRGLEGAPARPTSVSSAWARCILMQNIMARVRDENGLSRVVSGHLLSRCPTKQHWLQIYLYTRGPFMMHLHSFTLDELSSASARGQNI